MTMKINIALYIVSAILLLCIVLGTVSNQTPFFLNKESCGKGISFFIDARSWLGEITDFAVHTNVIYILYENKGILDCYGVDGTYLHSYYLDLGKKGNASLFARNEKVYLKSKKNRFFVFTNGNYIGQYEVETQNLFSEISNLQNEIHNTGGKEYQLQGSSIWCEGKKVIDRPAWLTVFQGLTLYLFGVCSFITMCILIYIKGGYR